MQINDFKDDFNKVVEFLKTDIAGLRTGRASAAIVDTITVEAYGVRQPLKTVASVTVVDSKTLMIDPWDKSILASVEKGIREANIGVNPVNDGRGIRLSMPELTVERRQELTKILHQRLENARISVRKVREEIRDIVNSEEKNGGISEDEKFKFFENLDKMVKDYNDEIKNIGEKKEEEINTI